MNEFNCATLIRSGNEQGNVLVNQNIFTIGRALSCNYVLKSKTASREHCRIEFDNGRWYLVDSSTNGTFLNAQLLVKARSPPLRDGDKIVVTSPDFTFTFMSPAVPDSDVSDAVLAELADQLIEMVDNFEHPNTSHSRSGSSSHVNVTKPVEFRPQSCDNSSAEDVNRTHPNAPKPLVKAQSHLVRPHPQASGCGPSGVATCSAVTTREPPQCSSGVSLNKRRKTDEGTNLISTNTASSHNITETSGFPDRLMNRTSEMASDNGEHLTEEIRFRGNVRIIGGDAETLSHAASVNSLLSASVDNNVVIGGETREARTAQADDSAAAAAPAATESRNVAQESIDIAQNELQCSICTEMFIKAVTLNCSHSFCSHCITEWKKTRSVCPICRTNIQTISSTIVLDNFIEKVLETASEEEKQSRKEIVAEREELAQPKPKPAVGARTHPIEISSDDTDSDYDDSDAYHDYYRGYDYYGGYGNCYICGESGHWANACYSRRGRRRR